MRIETRERVVEAEVTAYLGAFGSIRIRGGEFWVNPPASDGLASPVVISLDDLKKIIAEYDRVVSEDKK